MTRQRILVTGATDGIGRQTALELCRLGAHVLVHGRSAAKVERACAELRRAAPGASLEGVVGDLASFRQVRALAQEVERRAERLDVLLHNAGVFMNERELTEDGHEVTFQVNHLSVFLLTHLLLPLVQRSAPARIVTVASAAHAGGRIDFDDLDLEEDFGGYEAYAASKLANVLFTFELAERLRGTGVTANCLHPGVIGTKLLRAGFGMAGGEVEEGAATSVYLATSPEVAEVTGEYFVRQRAAQPSAQARDVKLRRALWEKSAELLGLTP